MQLSFIDIPLNANLDKLIFKLNILIFKDPINLNIEGGDVTYYTGFFSIKEANELFKDLLDTIEWQQDHITLFGKTHLQPRLTALYASNNNPYSYSNITMYPKVFTEPLIHIKALLEQKLNTLFTSCLVNLYRDGNDSNGWHADNEKELGEHPIIASLSFGAERIFQLKHKTKKELKYKIKLEHGSLIVMKGATQDHWLHQIPKTKKQIGERINLTFRIIA